MRSFHLRFFFLFTNERTFHSSAAFEVKNNHSGIFPISLKTSVGFRFRGLGLFCFHASPLNWIASAASKAFTVFLRYVTLMMLSQPHDKILSVQLRKHKCSICPEAVVKLSLLVPYMKLRKFSEKPKKIQLPIQVETKYFRDWFCDHKSCSKMKSFILRNGQNRNDNLRIISMRFRF